MPEIVLHGCTPEPLMSYLKALGVLRLVAEQADPEARGALRGGVFVLASTFDEATLLGFFREDYKPTPLLVPWSGNDFFEVNGDGDRGPFTKTPTGSKVVEAILASASARLEPYRQTIRVALGTMRELGINHKADIEGTKGKRNKARFLAGVRASLPDSLVPWIDAAAIIEADSLAFNALLGSGGVATAIHTSRTTLCKASGTAFQTLMLSVFIGVEPGERRHRVHSRCRAATMVL